MIKFTTYRSITKQHVEYDCVYLDECHNLLRVHENYLAFYNGDILGLTGTPPRHKHSEKGIMVNFYCPVVYEYTADTAIDDKILNNYKIIVHRLSLSPHRTHKMTTKAGKVFTTSEQKHYEYWSTEIEKQTFSFSGSVDKLRIMRMKGLMDYGSKERYVHYLLQHLDNKCIIFCNTTDQADKICPNSYHSKNPDSEVNLEKFKQGEVNCIAAVQQLSEGINIPGLKYGIIMHAYANERKTAQRLGRLLRLSTDDESIIHILCYKNTVDEEWIKSALTDFDESKITWIDA
jgi:superfamily II DNA or RNA helicase